LKNVNNLSNSVNRLYMNTAQQRITLLVTTEATEKTDWATEQNHYVLQLLKQFILNFCWSTSGHNCWRSLSKLLISLNSRNKVKRNVMWNLLFMFKWFKLITIRTVDEWQQYLYWMSIINKDILMSLGCNRKQNT